MSEQLIKKDTIKSYFRIEDNETSDAELEKIQHRFERVVYNHGDIIITINDDPDYMYYLDSGLASVYNSEGKQVNLMRDGTFFGEYGVMTGEKRLSTVKAEGKLVAYRISKDNLMEIMAAHPALFSETMKRLYRQISNKHEDLIKLSNMRRGVLYDPNNRHPLSNKQMLMQYGSLAIVFILSFIFVPADATTAPVFLLPLAFMVIYAIVTRRTMESLIVSGLLAALLLARLNLLANYTDSLMTTMADKGNVFTVLVMALMGGFITLVEASGALTAFKKLMTARVNSKKHALLSSVGVLILTSIDDCLNLLCASTSMRTAFDKNRVSREESSLLLSFMPIAICSFVPVSLWGIYIVANINTGVRGEELELFYRSIPFNFYSITAIIGMLALCLGVIPKTKELSDGIKRVENGGNLYPNGSLGYLHKDEDSMHGKIRNLMLPIIVLTAASLLVRSFARKNFALDSACGLLAALIFMFFLFCGQRLMSPEQFMDHLMTGIQSMVQPIALYIITMCFSAMLTELQMEYYFDNIAIGLSDITWIIPVVIFVSAMLLTSLLGSSWAMYVLTFPLVIRLGALHAINLPLCCGAVCAAGIAGEKNCLLSGDAMVVATALGINPEVVLKLRLKYSAAFSILTALFYLVAGRFM